MRINRGRLPDLQYPPLDDAVQATFRDRQIELGWIPIGAQVYRYGSDPSQAHWGRGPWVFATEERFDFTNEAIEWCSLLDATFQGLAPTNAGKPTGVWNTADWRCTLTAKGVVPVYVGFAAPLSFDLSTTRIYRGPGDQMPHRSTTGGATQVLIHGGEFDKFAWAPPVRLQPTRLQS